ncbi:MAG TPA: hypothetical protein VJG90_09275 [Candidatus Nanoarchaeia archaeon]|nr:hypothetical protein [Candidatus Nanoarchaeia archaeon]
MYKTEVNPERVLRWQHNNTTQALEDIARKGQLSKLGYVPVFDLPEECASLGDYVLIDGHKRYEAARRSNVCLPILVVQEAADFTNIPEYNASEYYDQSPEEFERFRQRIVGIALMNYRTISSKPNIE